MHFLDSGILLEAGSSMHTGHSCHWSAPVDPESEPAPRKTADERLVSTDQRNPGTLTRRSRILHPKTWHLRKVRRELRIVARHR